MTKIHRIEFVPAGTNSENAAEVNVELTKEEEKWFKDLTPISSSIYKKMGIYCMYLSLGLFLLSALFLGLSLSEKYSHLVSGKDSLLALSVFCIVGMMGVHNWELSGVSGLVVKLHARVQELEGKGK